MKKGSIAILVIIIMILLGGLDYFFNIARNRDVNGIASGPEARSATPATVPLKSPVDDWTALGGPLSRYQLVSRSRVQHLFEKVGFQPETPYTIFYYLLQTPGQEVMEIYEIKGPDNQGNITYFNIKQQFLQQLSDATSTINEVGAYGHNSFFYNDLNYPQTAFLIVQVGSSVYGFKYLKEPAESFEAVKAAIGDLMAQ